MMTKQLAIAFCAGAACCGGLLVATGFAPEDKSGAMNAAVRDAVQDAKKAASPESMEEQMEQWAQANQLGPEHQKLAKMSGTWAVEASFIMDPSAPAMESSGTMKTKTVLNGRYVQGHFSLPDFMGMPFEGIAITGYDTVDKQYVSTWIDSVSTGIFMTTGTMSDDGKVLTMKGTGVEPDGSKTEMKMVTTFHGDDKLVDEFYKQQEGEWTRTGTITYTRTGASAHAGD